MVQEPWNVACERRLIAATMEAVRRDEKVSGKRQAVQHKLIKTWRANGNCSSNSVSVRTGVILSCRNPAHVPSSRSTRLSLL